MKKILKKIQAYFIFKLANLFKKVIIFSLNYGYPNNKYKELKGNFADEYDQLRSFIYFIDKRLHAIEKDIFILKKALNDNDIKINYKNNLEE